ncbi:helix-turn-helix domain-containing protein [Pseudoduganella violaceinigra]|uniref:helix-turn-helix domain-containing protein n=1 Tax=Pseudoduganella violaceinigra TaxID=246602 RepID=UPI00040272C0|nr:helix-turn-helix domain-containing protein [Pseudoduganella violaceinigra]
MDSEQDKPVSQQYASAPGAALVAAREAMGLSVEQVADQLKLAPRQVLAIEQGNIDALPNRAVARGFIRAYAKAVRLDPAPLVAMVEVEAAEGHATATVRPTKVTASFQESRFPSLTERNNGKPLGAIVAGVAVLALAGAAAAWKMGVLPPLNLAPHATVGSPAASEPAPPVVVAPPAAQPAEVPLQTPNVPLISVPPQPGSNSAPDAVAGVGAQGGAGSAAASPVVPPAAQEAVGAAPSAQAANAPVLAPANRPSLALTPSVANAPAAAPGLMPAKPNAVAPAAAPAPAAAAPAAAQAPVVGAAGGKLVLTVKEDSWLEIRRGGQAKLVARMARAGSTETFTVRENDVLIVGKPGAVSASLAGGPLALPQGPGKTYSLVNIK